MKLPPNLLGNWGIAVMHQMQAAIGESVRNEGAKKHGGCFVEKMLRGDFAKKTRWPRRKGRMEIWGNSDNRRGAPFLNAGGNSSGRVGGWGKPGGGGGPAAGGGGRRPERGVGGGGVGGPGGSRGGGGGGVGGRWGVACVRGGGSGGGGRGKLYGKLRGGQCAGIRPWPQGGGVAQLTKTKLLLQRLKPTVLGE